MQTNTLLSFIGTGAYTNCVYALGANLSAPTHYSAHALLELRDGYYNKAKIFTTKQAREVNGTDLFARLKKAYPNICLELIDIPDGRTDDEIWELFDTLQKSVDDNESVSIDITHSFRSLPIVTLSALYYARTSKNIKVDSIYYAAYEARTCSGGDEVKQVPILNLSHFIEILDWSQAIDHFLKFGSTRSLRNLAEKDLKSLLKESRGSDKEAQVLNAVVRFMDEFAGNVQTCRGRKIGHSVGKVKKYLEECTGHPRLKLFQPLLEPVKAIFARFTRSEIQNGLQAARWCLEKNLVQQGFTILQETIVSALVINHSMAKDGDDLKRDCRLLVTQAMKIYSGNISQSYWKEPASLNVKYVKELLERFEKTPELATCLSRLSQSRNDLNHAGMNNDATEANSFISALKERIEEAERCLM